MMAVNKTKLLLWGFYAICALLVLAELVVERNVYHPWEGLFGFYAWFSFAGCVVLVLLAKLLGRLVRRREDYYEQPGHYTLLEKTAIANTKDVGGEEQI